MIGKDQIAEAARYADAEVEEHGLLAWAEHHKVDLHGLMYVAGQRALRAGMVLDGQDPNRAVDYPTIVSLPPEIQRLIPPLMALWMDAFAAGLTVREEDHG